MALFLGAVGLCGRSSGAEPSEAGKVIGQIGHADLHLGTCDADRADEQPHTVLLGGKDMFDARADPGARRIGLRLQFGELAPRRTAELDPLM